MLRFIWLVCFSPSCVCVCCASSSVSKWARVSGCLRACRYDDLWMLASLLFPCNVALTRRVSPWAARVSRARDMRFANTHWGVSLLERLRVWVSVCECLCVTLHVWRVLLACASRVDMSCARLDGNASTKELHPQRALFSVCSDTKASCLHD